MLRFFVVMKIEIIIILKLKRNYDWRKYFEIVIILIDNFAIF